MAYNMRYPLTTATNIPDVGAGSGVAPHIDTATGNWFVGTTDTGVKAQGPKGDIGPAGPTGASGETGPKGPAGTNGTNGAPGEKGADGITPSIDPTTKNWKIGETDTGIKAEGAKGAKGDKGNDGAPGAAGTNGTDGAPGAQGPKGADGVPPTVQIGTVTKLASTADPTVTVEKVEGAENTWKFNFGIPGPATV